MRRRRRLAVNPISIHALREEGDGLLIAPTRCLCNFYPRPPRGGRPSTLLYLSAPALFLSTPSARRATTSSELSISDMEFLSTPSARRATRPLCPVWPRRGISIHALREEGDHAAALCIQCGQGFLSTPSARRATHSCHIIAYALNDFYPRPPRGGRLVEDLLHVTPDKFLSTPSARRATVM